MGEAKIREELIPKNDPRTGTTRADDPSIHRPGSMQVALSSDAREIGITFDPGQPTQHMVAINIQSAYALCQQIALCIDEVNKRQRPIILNANGIPIRRGNGL
jgi:hypothetical protein